MTTIRDIAQQAGVSTATVSKVINNYPDVGAKTREKVLSIMQRENYRPNAIARSLSTNKSNSVGVFFKDHLNSGLSHPFFREIIYGMERTFARKNFDIILFTSEWDDKYSYIDKCKYRHVEGAVMMGVPRSDPYLHKLVNSNFPAVFVDLDIVGKSATYIISNNIEGARKAVRYLHQLGHVRIGMILGQTITKPTQDRLFGFQQEIDQLNLPYNSHWILEGEFSEAGGYRAMQKIMKMENKPTAIFCHSDEMAIGAMKAVEGAGLEVPRDFSIIGFDDIQISRYVRPRLTTIRQDKIHMGVKAAEMLLSLIRTPEKSYPPVVLPVELIERDSCRAIRE